VAAYGYRPGRSQLTQARGQLTRAWSGVAVVHACGSPHLGAASVHCRPVNDSLPLLSRIWLAFSHFFHVLLDGRFAWRASRLQTTDALPGPAPQPEAAAEQQERLERARTTAALQLLELLQREGRLVDFLQQDITSFGDAEIGAAARVVHEGCRKALAAHARISPVRHEAEGSRVTLEQLDPSAVKLTGNVTGSAPYTGTLTHRGWRAETLSLPQPLEGHDFFVLAPAEVEL
jgi:hypothetical protein